MFTFLHPKLIKCWNYIKRRSFLEEEKIERQIFIMRKVKILKNFLLQNEGFSKGKGYWWGNKKFDFWKMKGISR